MRRLFQRYPKTEGVILLLLAAASAIIIAIALVMAPRSALSQPLRQPPNIEKHLVLHNGSLMSFVLDRSIGLVKIIYVEPRPGLAAIGVMPGTRLFQGSWHGGVLAGVAVVFAGECGPIGYNVSGGDLPDGSLVLRGPAPLVGPFCENLGLAWTPNSVLPFVLPRQ